MRDNNPLCDTRHDQTSDAPHTHRITHTSQEFCADLGHVLSTQYNHDLGWPRIFIPNHPQATYQILKLSPLKSKTSTPRTIRRRGRRNFYAKYEQKMSLYPPVKNFHRQVIFQKHTSHTPGNSSQLPIPAVPRPHHPIGQP